MHGQIFSANESSLKGDFILKPHQLYQTDGIRNKSLVQTVDLNKDVVRLGHWKHSQNCDEFVEVF